MERRGVSPPDNVGLDDCGGEELDGMEDQMREVGLVGEFLDGRRGQEARD